eukprot:g45089.t1
MLLTVGGRNCTCGNGMCSRLYFCIGGEVADNRQSPADIDDHLLRFMLCSPQKVAPMTSHWRFEVTPINLNPQPLAKQGISSLESLDDEEIVSTSTSTSPYEEIVPLSSPNDSSDTLMTLSQSFSDSDSAMSPSPTPPISIETRSSSRGLSPNSETKVLTNNETKFLTCKDLVKPIARRVPMPVAWHAVHVKAAAHQFELDMGLLCAVQSGQFKQVCSLLSRGADASFLHPGTGKTCLLLAMKNSSPRLISRLIEAKAVVNESDSSGWTALMQATVLSRKDVLQVLLERKASTDMADDRLKRTAVHWAASRGEAECLKLLLEWGGDPLVKDKLGQNALELALQGRHHTCVHVLHQVQITPVHFLAQVTAFSVLPSELWEVVAAYCGPHFEMVPSPVAKSSRGGRFKQAFFSWMGGKAISYP